MHFSKRNLILFLILFSIFSHFLFRYLVFYSEKTSFIWEKIGKRNLVSKNYDLIILGDSQIMSGLHPSLLNQLLAAKGKSMDILYYPRPSEQPEGIYKILQDFKKANITSKMLLVNISPVTTSKNNIVEANKTLTQNFHPFSFQLFLEPNLNKFYLKTLSGNIYYLFLQVFPLLKLNANFSNEIKIIPGSEGITYNAGINSFLNVNFFGNLILNRKNNLFLDESLERENFYFEWGNFSRFTGECIERTEPLFLPVGIEPAFLTPRKEALEFWLKIGDYARQNNIKIFFLYTPFSPEAELKIGSTRLDSPIHNTLTQISQKFGQDSILKIDSALFQTGDFRDYTHLNVCGMMKLTKELANRL
ncbi:MAG: hypothetical protein KBA66_14410 [Leptospiraceae bacterium]|nr:hypothetical protein [Leptospiraceae bacterium]